MTDALDRPLNAKMSFAVLAGFFALLGLQRLFVNRLLVFPNHLVTVSDLLSRARRQPKKFRWADGHAK